MEIPLSEPLCTVMGEEERRKRAGKKKGKGTPHWQSALQNLTRSLWKEVKRWSSLQQPFPAAIAATSFSACLSFYENGLLGSKQALLIFKLTEVSLVCVEIVTSCK